MTHLVHSGHWLNRIPTIPFEMGAKLRVTEISPFAPCSVQKAVHSSNQFRRGPRSFVAVGAATFTITILIKSKRRLFEKSSKPPSGQTHSLALFAAFLRLTVKSSYHLAPLHCRMQGIDRDLIRGGHYGQPSCEPHPQAEHMAAPTSGATWRFSLPTRSRRHMARSRRLSRCNNSSAIRGDPEARGATLAPPLVTQCMVRPRILTINCQVTAAGRGPSKGKHSPSARHAPLRQRPLVSSRRH
jgi:hypothetical protein